ncbi:hypothetical protein ScPMuIL_006788 [Solemya velum]
MTELESSDGENSDSDAQLQEAFAAGKLKQGLYVESEASKPNICDIRGMKRKLEELKSSLEWAQRLDITSSPAPTPAGIQHEDLEEVHDDFQRELRFYRQAQATVLEGIPRLNKAGIPTHRPEDYFAEMAKTDDHMKKVRENLLEKQLSMDRSEKAKKFRELRKYGKKVQQEVLLKRQKEKREMLDAVKKFRKGQQDKLDFLEDMEPSAKKQKQSYGPRQGQQKPANDIQPNKKRQSRDTKYGFGGQKKRSKYNTAKSAADMSDFSRKINQPRGAKGKGKGKGKKFKNQRAGKSKRQKFKNKN